MQYMFWITYRTLRNAEIDSDRLPSIKVSEVGYMLGTETATGAAAQKSFDVFD